MTVLQTERLTLRPWVEDDAEAMFAMFGDAETMRYWNTPPAPDVAQVREGIRRSVTTTPEAHLAWAVLLRESGRAVGFVNYHHREVRNRRLEIGYLVDRAFWRQGFAREAITTLIRHCFEALDTYRIEATVSPENRASISLLEKLGFRLEGGPMRARMWTSDGRALDALMFGLLKPEWNAT